MPDLTPTKEQFDAAAQRVAASAPAGLSREQFFDLIDKEIASDPNTKGTVIGDVKSGATPKSVEGDPSTGGFFRNASKDAIETAGGIGEGLFNAIRHPINTMTALPTGVLNHIKDVASDMHPGQAWEAIKKGNLDEAAGQLLPVGAMYKTPVTIGMDVLAAGDVAKGFKSIADMPARNKIAADMAKVDRYMPNKSSTLNIGRPGEGVPTAGASSIRPIIDFDRYLPNTSATIKDATGRDLGTEVSGADSRPAGPWDGNSQSTPTAPGDNHQELLSKLGGRQIDTPPQPKPDAVREGPSSPWPPEGGHGDWHAFPDDATRKAAPQSERDSARALHRDTGEMDSRYNFLTDPNNTTSMAMGPEALLFGLTRDLIREQVRKIRNNTAGSGPVRRGVAYGAGAIKAGAAAGNIARIGSPDKRD